MAYICRGINDGRSRDSYSTTAYNRAITCFCRCNWTVGDQVDSTQMNTKTISILFALLLFEWLCNIISFVDVNRRLKALEHPPFKSFKLENDRYVVITNDVKR